jgi:hypothetical protein
MSRRSYVIDKIVRTEKMIHPNPDNLWCCRCQRGITGHKEYEGLKSGDDCPFCEILAMDGDIAYEARGVLKTCQEVTDEWLEKAKMHHKMDQFKQVRSIKDTGDVALDKVKEQDKIIEKLRLQIEEMNSRQVKVDAVAKEVVNDEPVVGKVTTSDKKGSK